MTITQAASSSGRDQAAGSEAAHGVGTASSPLASEALIARYAEIPLPPDPALMAPLCADTMDALLAAEEDIRQLQSSLGLTRRIGIVIGIVMAVNRVSQDEAEHLLRHRGQGLSSHLRSVADRIINARNPTDADSVRHAILV